MLKKRLNRREKKQLVNKNMAMVSFRLNSNRKKSSELSVMCEGFSFRCSIVCENVFD